MRNLPQGAGQVRSKNRSRIQAGCPLSRVSRLACRRRRGLGSNLNRLGVDDSMIQRILRHSNISTTQAYYIKTAADDLRSAMSKLENSLPEPAPALTDTYGTLEPREEATGETIQ